MFEFKILRPPARTPGSRGWVRRIQPMARV